MAILDSAVLFDSTSLNISQMVIRMPINHSIFLWNFQELVFLEHFWTAASKTDAEKKLTWGEKFSAWD